MSQKLNHHFVPQYHFRLFTGGNRYIHVASREGSRFVHFASVKGQCARHKFYGDEGIEDWLSNLESRHAAVYRTVLDIAWKTRTTTFSDDEDYHLREAILLQRSRTPRNACIHASSMDQMMLYAYCEHLKGLSASPKQQATIAAIQRGKATLKNSEFTSLIFSLRMAPRAVMAISDLSLLILRNQTTVPFIFGDTPCVFSNCYMRSTRDYGVLGFMTPGLMVTLPIDSRTQVLLYDAAVYTPDYLIAGCIDVYRIADVSLLNALQIHSAEENVYFSDVSAEDYVRELLFAHRRILQDHRGGFVIYTPGQILIDGVPNKSEILHAFEPQLPITLDLSFISTASLSPSENLNRPRDPVLAQQIEQKLDLPSQASPLKMDELAKWLESEICIE